jgi:hypothetical protein
VERVVLVETVADREPDRIVLQEAAAVQLAPGHGDEPEEQFSSMDVQLIARGGQFGPSVGISRIATLSGAVDDLLVVAHRQVRITPGGGAEQPLEHGRFDIVVAVDEADPPRCRPVDARVGSGRHATRTVIRQQHG